MNFSSTVIKFPNSLHIRKPNTKTNSYPSVFGMKNWRSVLWGTKAIIIKLNLHWTKIEIVMQSVNSENADAAPAQITSHAVHIITKWKISQKARKYQSKPSFSWLSNNLISAPIEAKIVSVLVLQRNRDHGVWKLQKKLHFILRVKRATFTEHLKFAVKQWYQTCQFK